MKNTPLPFPTTMRLLAASLLFAGARSQEPLFSSNQNTYFLSGLAHAGYGYLSADWRAQQTDPVPVFSAMVQFVHSIGAHWMFYVLFFGLATVYAASLFAIARHSSAGPPRLQQTAVFFSLLTLLHSPWILGHFSPMLWQVADLSTNGVAGQYILGTYLQPSAFGVLLIASLALFLGGKEQMAILCAVVAATIHTSMILHTGILVAAYMAVIVSERRALRTARLAALAIVLILPIVLYVGTRFFLSDTQATHSVAQAISVEARLPHHAKISVWFSVLSWFQLAIVLAGLFLSRGQKRLFTILLVCTLATLGLTLLQAISGSKTLALLFPWRTSAWIVPVSTAIVLGSVSVHAGAIVDMIPKRGLRSFARACVVALSLGFLGGACLLGVNGTLSEARADRDHGTVISHARMHAGRDQTYLIPVNFERFRLAAGLPIFVDWKSCPYRSSEIVEWYDRVRLANAFYEARTPAEARVAWINIQEHTIVTHIIVESGKEYLLDALQLRPIYRDGTYALVALR